MFETEVGKTRVIEDEQQRLGSKSINLKSIVNQPILVALIANPSTPNFIEAQDALVSQQYHQSNIFHPQQ